MHLADIIGPVRSFFLPRQALTRIRHQLPAADGNR